MIPYQILQTKMIGIVWQTIKRITDEILEKGFKNKQTNKQPNKQIAIIWNVSYIHLEIKINLHSSKKYPYTFDS